MATDILLDNPISLYGKRWQIQTLFGCLKSKGFRFEDTHIIRLERIERLIALLAVAFCIAHKVGEWRHEEKAIVIKKHCRLAQSYFRYGLDFLRDALFNFNEIHIKNLFSLLRKIISIPTYDIAIKRIL